MEVFNAIMKEIHRLLLIFLTVVFVVQPLLDYFTIGFDDSDSKEKKERSGFKIYTDFKYGWEYLVTNKGIVIHRLDENGKHVNINKK